MNLRGSSKFLRLSVTPAQRKLPAALSAQATSQKAVATLTDAGNLAIASQQLFQARQHLSPSELAPVGFCESN